MMIAKIIAAAGIAAVLALPGAAQTFTHTTHGVTHSHDITTYKTYGTCCLQTSCCTQAYSTCGQTSHGHHGHGHGHHGHYGHSQHYGHATTTRTYTHAPVTRTYTRTYTHAPTTVRTYTRSYTSAPTTRRVYVETPRTEALSYHPDTYPRYHEYHDDRGEPYAHYDRKWKSRTR